MKKVLSVYINFINFFTEIREFISMCHLLGKDVYKYKSSYHILCLPKLQQKVCGILYLPYSEFCCSHNWIECFKICLWTVSRFEAFQPKKEILLKQWLLGLREHGHISPSCSCNLNSVISLAWDSFWKRLQSLPCGLSQSHWEYLHQQSGTQWWATKEKH